MAKLKAQAVQSYANFAALPAPVLGIYEVAVAADSGVFYLSDGSSWNAVGSGGNIDGGTAASLYGGSTTINGGGA
jgi:hypothetical protein